MAAGSALVYQTMQDFGDLEAQLTSKEKEWKELQALRIQKLEAALAEANSQLSTQRERFLRLRDDFQYNLGVLEERDRELERYDAMAVRVQSEDNVRQEQLSELRIQLSKLQDALGEERKHHEDLQSQYHKRGADYRLQLDRVQSMKEDEIQKLREENESLKRDLQRQIQASDGELALQKQEMLADFDSEMRKREHEFNLKLDETQNIVLSHELKVTLLNKEVEAHSKALRQANESLQASEELYQCAQKEILKREWDLKNTTAVKDSRIKELEEKINQMECRHKKEKETNNRKHAELERRVREREASLGAMREAHTSDLQEQKKRTAELQRQVDGLIMEKERRQESHAAELQSRVQQIHELRAQLERTQAGWDAYITQVSKETVAKDTELLRVEERESKLKADIQKCKEDIEKYKQHLTSGIQREQALEKKLVQVELDWERRCEDVRVEHYLKSEEVIQSLTQARDEVTAELKEKEQKVQETVTLLRAVTIERDQALCGARPAATTITTSQAAVVKSNSFPSEEIWRLQQQNNSLRELMADMKRQLEAMSKDALQTQTPVIIQNSDPSQNTPGAVEYNKELEEELQNLKAKCRHLEDQIEETSKTTNPSVPPAVSGFPVAPDNAYLQNHIRSLNETIGGLRVEKAASAAALKKQEVRLAHLEAIVAQLTQQSHSKQMENEELRLELTNQKRAAVTEETGLKQKLTAAEMQLEEVRREAEEYQKSSLLHNLETVALGNQVSALKMDIASRREPIVLEPSEMVKQLQDENLRLRQQLLSQGLGKDVAVADVSLLQCRLKNALHWITRLNKEKWRITDKCNRLRTQLEEAGLCDAGDKPSQNPMEKKASKAETVTRAQGRLSTLEQLQYKLTTQVLQLVGQILKELQYAQREQNMKKPIMLNPNFSESDSGDKGEQTGPPGENPHKQGESTQTLRREAPRPTRRSNPGPSFCDAAALNTTPLSHPNPWNLPAKAQESHHPLSKENTPLVLPESEVPVRPPSSAQTLESLQDMWQMLEQSMCSTLPTSSENEDRDGVAAKAKGEQDKNVSNTGLILKVHGLKAVAQEKKKPARTTNQPVKNTRPVAKVARIRNYNIKD